jgi:hypothetical protein
MAAPPMRLMAATGGAEAVTTLALIEAPDPTQTQRARPAIAIAASSRGGRWRPGILAVTTGGRNVAVRTAARKSMLGRALTPLADAEPYLIDRAGWVEVELVDPEQWLTSCEESALSDGTNLAVLGSELLQFGEAIPLGEGQFRLKKLVRGRAGTEWATDCHRAGDVFCLLAPESLQSISLSTRLRGSDLSVAHWSGASTSKCFTAESVKPLSPVNLRYAFGDAGDLAICWTRRSRTGFDWLDEVDASLGETVERYAVRMVAAAQTLEITTDIPAAVIRACDMTAMGKGPATIEVRQIGDWAASRPAQLTINLV